MNWLVWREYRQNRPIVFFAAGLFLLPYVIALASLVWDGLSSHAVPSVPGLCFALIALALYSTGIAQVAIAFLGGNLIAGERADRSAEFIACLPLSRSRIVVSKVALVAVTSAGIWLPNLLVVLAASTGISEREFARWFRGGWLDVAAVFCTIATVSLVFYGVSWLFSSFLESPTFSVCGGLVAPGVIWTGIYLLNWRLMARGIDLQPWVLRSFYPVCVVLSLASFTAGTWYYLRRVEP